MRQRGLKNSHLIRIYAMGRAARQPQIGGGTDQRDGNTRAVVEN